MVKNLGCQGFQRALQQKKRLRIQGGGIQKINPQKRFLDPGGGGGEFPNLPAYASVYIANDRR